MPTQLRRSLTLLATAFPPWQRSKLNASEFGGVYLLQGLEALDALRIEQMEQLDGERR